MRFHGKSALRGTMIRDTEARFGEGTMRARTFITRETATTAVAAFTCLGALHGHAAGEIAFQFTGAQSASATGNDAFFFTVGGADLLVTKLGQYNGTNESHTVAIYRTNAAFAPLELIVSRQITTTASYNGFEYLDVASANAVLKANERYFIIGNAGPGRQLVTGMGIGLGSGIKSFDAYRWNSSAAHDAVTTHQGNGVYWGSNFEYQTIPAPATLAVVGMLFGLLRRRQH